MTLLALKHHAQVVVKGGQRLVECLIGQTCKLGAGLRLQ